MKNLIEVIESEKLLLIDKLAYLEKLNSQRQKDVKLLLNVKDEINFLTNAGTFRKRRKCDVITQFCHLSLDKSSCENNIYDKKNIFTVRLNEQGAFKVKAKNVPFVALLAAEIFLLPAFSLSTQKRRWIKENYNKIDGMLQDLNHLRACSCNLNFSRNDIKIFYRFIDSIKNILTYIDIIPKHERDAVHRLYESIESEKFLYAVNLIKPTFILPEKLNVIFRGKSYNIYCNSTSILSLNKDIVNLTCRQIKQGE